MPYEYSQYRVASPPEFPPRTMLAWQQDPRPRLATDPARPSRKEFGGFHAPTRPQVVYRPTASGSVVRVAFQRLHSALQTARLQWGPGDQRFPQDNRRNSGAKLATASNQARGLAP